ncbi:MAG: hypothetical protein ACTMHW_08955, partial [Hafnia alvei]
MINVINKYLYKAFGQDVWRIGVSNTSFLKFISEGELSIKWLEINKKNDYEADPFVFEMNGMAYIAFEKFRYTHGNAKIHCVDINGKEYNFFSEINKVKGHKSFPYIFHDGCNVYC